MNLDQADEQPLCLLDLLQFGYVLHKMMEDYSENDPLVDEESPVADVIESVKPLKDNPLVSLDGESPVTGVIDSLEALRGDLERFRLRSSNVLAGEMIDPLIFDLEIRRDNDERTMGDDAGELKDALADLFNAARNEASRQYMYPVAPAKYSDDFGLPGLLEPPLAPEFVSSLREANRCLSVGFELAAVLSTLLATEVITRYYYEAVTEKSPPKGKTWGQLVEELEGAKHQCPRRLTRKLRRIVAEYRNPAMHARLEMKSGMAPKVWRICAQVAQEMIRNLLTRGLVRKPPTEDEIDTILVTAYAIRGKINRNDLMPILKGIRNDKVLEEGWNKSSDYGAMEHLTPAQITKKVDWCINEKRLRLEYDQDGVPLLYLPGQWEEQAKELWVERLLGWFEDWQETGQPEEIWSWLEMINRSIKFMLLEAISERDRRDLAPVLRAWFPHEVKAVRTAINRTLQSLGLQALPRPGHRPTQTKPC